MKVMQLVTFLLFVFYVHPSTQSIAVSGPDASQVLRDAIKVTGIRAHQKALQNVADQHGGHRSAGSKGYEASVQYIKSALENAGFKVTLQELAIPISRNVNSAEFNVVSPDQRVFQEGVDFANMVATGRTTITGDIEAVDLVIPSPHKNSSTSGCEAEDFKNFSPGSIALLQRGSCDFQTKIENAIAAKAKGIIIFNEGNEGRHDLFTSHLTPSKAAFPVMSASFSVGDVLRASRVNGPTGMSVRLKIDVTVDNATVQNIIAETDDGDQSRVVVVGAHLDSVKSGPGINDNGSGSAAILEIALKHRELALSPKNKLRFIWFAAEEFGLLGSQFYVASLTEKERQEIIAMLNFDMLGSSNYARFVYDGDGSAETDSPALAGPNGSAQIEKIFLDYFSSMGFANHPTAFDGRSDYGPFIEAGIPAGGLFSGAEGLKSRRLAAIYGGIAGAPFDPCYHRRCDDFFHTGGDESSALALKSLDELADAAAHAVVYLSSTRDLIGTKNRSSKKIDFEYRGGILLK